MTARGVERRIARKLLLLLLLATPLQGSPWPPAGFHRPFADYSSAPDHPVARFQEEAAESAKETPLFTFWAAGIAGAALPAGDFADLSGGGAKPGFVVGLELNVRSRVGLGWVTTVAAAVNSVDTLAVSSAFPPGGSLSVGSWGTIWLLTGLRYQREVAESIELFGTGQIGLLYGNSPDVNTDYGGYGDHLAGESKSSFAFGVGCGVLFNGAFSLEGRFVHGSPHYSLPFAGGGGEQPTSLFWFTGGILF